MSAELFVMVVCSTTGEFHPFDSVIYRVTHDLDPERVAQQVEQHVSREWDKAQEAER